MDPSMNPVEIEREILRFVDLLETATQMTAKRSRALALADADFRTAWAKAICAAEAGTVAEREAIAALGTQSEYRAKRVAEAVLEASKEAGRNMREQLSALRSINVNVRALLEHAS